MKLQQPWAGAALFVAALGMSSVSFAAPVSGQGTWETTLQPRDLDGSPATVEAYYDTTLNITWLANANYSHVVLGWDQAIPWAAGLSFNGIGGWRLPTTAPVNGSSLVPNLSYNGSTDFGYNESAAGSAYPGSTASEMAHMFYVTLGDKAYCNTSGVCNQAGYGLTNTGPFSNIQTSSYYWSATPDPSLTYDAYEFNFSNGYQADSLKTTSDYMWFVHSGDVGAPIVPVPAAVWLFGSGLLGLIGMARRKAA